MDLAKEHDLFVIEDCAQAHGASYKGRSVGSIGHIGCWSFCQDKIMTTGGEGPFWRFRNCLIVGFCVHFVGQLSGGVLATNKSLKSTINYIRVLESFRWSIGSRKNKIF